MLWVILPVFRDSASFAWVRSKIIPAVNLPVKFVAIDDTGGLDAELARLSDATTEVLACPFNMGHQRALVFGIRSLAHRLDDNDIVLTMDSDGQDSPDDVPRLLQAVQQNQAKDHIALARRTGRSESFSFRVLYFFFKLLFRLLTGTVVRTGNFAAYPARLIKKAIAHPYFDLCYSSTLLNLGFRLQYVDSARADRHEGQSHMSLTQLINHGIRMMMPFLDKISVRLIIFIAGLIAAGAVVFGAGLYLKLTAGWPFPLWLFFLFLIVLSVSVVALMNFLILFAQFSFYQKANGPS